MRTGVRAGQQRQQLLLDIEVTHLPRRNSLPNLVKSSEK